MTIIIIHYGWWSWLVHLLEERKFLRDEWLAIVADFSLFFVDKTLFTIFFFICWSGMKSGLTKYDHCLIAQFLVTLSFELMCLNFGLSDFFAQLSYTSSIIWLKNLYLKNGAKIFENAALFNAIDVPLI